MKVTNSSQQMIDMFTYKIVSSNSIADVSEKVPSWCEKYKFSLLQNYAYHDILMSKGFPINRKVYIFEICQAKTASEMLNYFPHFSIFMPCKIAVYEDKGETIISTMNMEIMIKAITSSQVLFNDATLLYNTLKSLMASMANPQVN